MTDYDRAGNCYEQALRHNPYSVQALSQIASLCRGREQFSKVKKEKESIYFIWFAALPVIETNQLAGCWIFQTNFVDSRKQWRNLGCFRSLLSDDGQFARSLSRLSTSVVPSSQSSGKCLPLLALLCSALYDWLVASTFHRTLNYGMVLVFFTIDMAPWNMLKRLFQPSWKWNPSLRRPTKFISVWVSFISNSRSTTSVFR